jgi:alcohol dehydrogenase class IV
MAMATARLGGVHAWPTRWAPTLTSPTGDLRTAVPYTLEYYLPYATARYAHVAALMGVVTPG